MGNERTRFKSGQSGNPGGRPKGWGSVIMAAREHTEEAIKTLADALHDEDVRARIKAAEVLLDRGHGRPREIEIVELTEEEREARILELLDIARARRDGLVAVAEESGSDAGDAH